jgi:hypothetical protein
MYLGMIAKPGVRLAATESLWAHIGIAPVSDSELSSA